MRPTYQTRTILLRAEAQLETAIAMLRNAPLDPDKPLELVLREESKVRGLDANAAMWAGPLRDIAEQAWYGDPPRQYSEKTWHETYKRLYLPEEFDAELCREGYRKWDHDRDGERVLIGSTTQLTVKGFAQYMTQVEADGAGMGVMFSVNPRERAT